MQPYMRNKMVFQIGQIDWRSGEVIRFAKTPKHLPTQK